VGKRIAIGFAGDQGDDLWLVLHLLIAGRLHRQKRGAKVSRPRGLAAVDFLNGTLTWTEAGSQKRASLDAVRGEAGLSALDPGGLEVLDTDARHFASVLALANHTLKRALSDPRLFSGIGNAYPDEILFEARLSSLALTQKLSNQEIERLFQVARATLSHWAGKLRNENGDEFHRK
jgi:formamidopyrimidine-DNA glycosylase